MVNYADWERELISDPELRQEGWRIHSVGPVGSTMDVAKQLADLAVPQLVLASEQLTGRGREGRSWLALPGSFIATYKFPLGSQAATLEGLSLAVGVVIAEALDSQGGSLMLKWPNDLVSKGLEKIGGILIEVIRNPAPYVLVGIGINLRSSPEHQEACSFRLTSIESLLGTRLSPVQCALLISSELWSSFKIVEQAGFSHYLKGFRDRDILLGRQLRINQLGSIVQGIAKGVSEQGALRLLQSGVKESGKELEVISGHIESIGA